MSGTKDLDARAAAGETVVPGGTGGKSVEAQQHLAEGYGREIWNENVRQRRSGEGFRDDGRSKGGQARSEQLGHEGYVEMGKKGGSATADMAGGEAAEVASRQIDDSKFTS